jgi:hypothetical protein
MEDLVNDLKGKVGLTDQQAAASIAIMKAYVMSKVPPMFSGVVESFFAKAPETGGVDITEIPS